MWGFFQGLSQCRSNKSVAGLARYVAAAEIECIRKAMSCVKFVSVISCRTRNSGFQEAEIVYIRTCHRGQTSAILSLLQNLNRGDADGVVK